MKIVLLGKATAAGGIRSRRAAQSRAREPGEPGPRRAHRARCAARGAAPVPARGGEAVGAARRPRLLRAPGRGAPPRGGARALVERGRERGARSAAARHGAALGGVAPDARPRGTAEAALAAAAAARRGAARGGSAREPRERERLV